MNSSSHAMPARISYDDYCQIPHDGNRYEVIDGLLHMSPAPAYRHQRLSVKLTGKLDHFVEGRGLGKVIAAPFDVLLSDTNIVQPDILFISNQRASIITPENAQGAPDLMIEILSKSNQRYDEVVKKQLYEAHGVLEYWIVDPVLETIHVYHLEGSVLKLGPVFIREQKDVLTSPLLPGFTCELNWLFDV